jgi:7-cyano-7-deazaguanine synthase in queuosine biosynthesis
MKPTTFINFSGGIDSTFYLYQWLTKNPKERILVHHCNYFSYSPKRGQHEIKAVQAILEKLKEMGLNNFEYVETTWGELPYPYHDIIGTSIAGALVVTKYESIQKVILPYWYKEIQAIRPYISTKGLILNTMPKEHRFRRAKDVFEAITGKKDIRHYIEFHHLKKSEMIGKLPDDILMLTHFCRAPKDGMLCGYCDSCKAIRPLLRMKNKESLFNFKK